MARMDRVPTVWQLTLCATSETPRAARYALTRQSDSRLEPISEAEAGAIATMVHGVSGHDGAAVLWFGIDEPPLDKPGVIEGALRVPGVPSDGGGREPVWVKWCAGSKEFAEILHRVWNGTRGVQIYPLAQQSQVETIALGHFNNRDYEAGLGLARGKLPQIEGVDDGLGLGLRAAFRFITRLTEPKLLRHLTDPFEPRKNLALLQDSRIFLWKGGYDEDVLLEFVADQTDLVPSICSLLEERGITVTVKEQQVDRR